MQCVSVLISLITLSMTASTYLFFQHDDYTSFDKKIQRRTPGVNDPTLITIVVCTLLYIMMNAPRIFANALVLSVSPALAIAMIVAEFVINLIICNRWALSLKKNAVFPSGFVTAAINYACPCYPIRKVGRINLFSALLIITKVVFLYPIISNEWLTIQLDQNPNILQCWNVTELLAEKSKVHVKTYPHLYDTFGYDSIVTCQEAEKLNSNLSESSYFQLPRFCACDEHPNDVLFNVTIPYTIGFLLATLVSGCIITLLIRRQKLTVLEDKIKNFKTKVYRVICCESNEPDNSARGDEVVLQNLVDPLPIETDDIHNKEKTTSKENQRTQTGWLASWMSFLLNVRTMFNSSQESAENCKCDMLLNSYRVVLLICIIHIVGIVLGKVHFFPNSFSLQDANIWW